MRYRERKKVRQIQGVTRPRNSLEKKGFFRGNEKTVPNVLTDTKILPCKEGKAARKAVSMTPEKDKTLKINALARAMMKKEGFGLLPKEFMNLVGVVPPNELHKYLNIHRVKGEHDKNEHENEKLHAFLTEVDLDKKKDGDLIHLRKKGIEKIGKIYAAPPLAIENDLRRLEVEIARAQNSKDALLYDTLNAAKQHLLLIYNNLDEKGEVDMDKIVDDMNAPEVVTAGGNLSKPIHTYTPTAVDAKGQHGVARDKTQDGFDNSHGIDVVDAATGQIRKDAFPANPAERIKVLNRMREASMMGDFELGSRVPAGVVSHLKGEVDINRPVGYRPRAGYADGKVFENVYAYEYALRMMHKMLLRRISIDQIAGALNLRIETVKRMKLELHKRLSEEMRYTDVYSLIGETNAFYNEMRAYGLKMMDEASKNQSITEQAMAASVAFKAEADRIKALDTARVFESSPVKLAKASENDRHDAKSMLDTLKYLLSDEKPEGELVEEGQDKPSLM